jgi:tight adherence protein C
VTAIAFILVLGIVVGAAVAGSVFSLSPPPPSLRLALLRLHRAAPTAPHETISRPSWTVVRLARLIGAQRLIGSSLRADLAITEHDEAWLFSTTALVISGGVALGPALFVVAEIAGIHLPWGLPLAITAVVGPSVGLAQVLALHSEAARRREAFSFALSAYLDLVVVSMAAGRGVEGALSVAAETGTGSAFEALRRALNGARLYGVPPWDALDDLGAQLGVAELSGIAASIRLAGASGARVRSSLAARAKALRARGLAEARAAAESETERMSVPVVLLVLGFIVLIGYPAVVQITTKL